jgi:hypothetical protein
MQGWMHFYLLQLFSYLMCHRYHMAWNIKPHYEYTCFLLLLPMSQIQWYSWPFHACWCITLTINNFNCITVKIIKIWYFENTNRDESNNNCVIQFEREKVIIVSCSFRIRYILTCLLVPWMVLYITVLVHEL